MGNHYGMNSGSAKGSYVGAPYNFVPFAKEPYARGIRSLMNHLQQKGWTVKSVTV